MSGNVGVSGGGPADPGPRLQMGSRMASAPLHPFVNPAVLALDDTLFDDLGPKEAKAIKLALLEYSRDISTRAATAYQAIIDAIK